MNKSNKIDPIVYFLLVLFFGCFGIHKFIDKNAKMGVLYLFTMGLFGIGWIIDIIKALMELINLKKDTIVKTTPMKNHPNQQESKPTFNYNANSNLDTFLQTEMLRIDAMSTDGFYFERYCAQLLLKNGFSKAEVTQGSGDFGVDILAEKDNITYAIQCKCYSNPVGNKAVQEAYSGKEFYKCMVAAVLTNNTFTKAAEETAKQTRVLLWDRAYLQELLSSIYQQNMKKPPVITTVTSNRN